NGDPLGSLLDLELRLLRGVLHVVIGLEVLVVIAGSGGVERDVLAAADSAQLGFGLIPDVERGDGEVRVMQAVEARTNLAVDLAAADQKLALSHPGAQMH